jgi:hypothetical protein
MFHRPEEGLYVRQGSQEERSSRYGKEKPPHEAACEVAAGQEPACKKHFEMKLTRLNSSLVRQVTVADLESFSVRYYRSYITRGLDNQAPTLDRRKPCDRDRSRWRALRLMTS